MIKSDEFEKALRKLHLKDQKRVVIAISFLETDPFIGKKLRGSHDGYYSLRVWPYRVLYFIHKHEITVIIKTVGHRKDVYRS